MNLSLKTVLGLANLSSDPDLEYIYDAPIHYIVMKGDEFTFNAERIEKLCAILDKIESTEGPGILVSVAESPKIYSTGFDLQYW